MKRPLTVMAWPLEDDGSNPYVSLLYASVGRTADVTLAPLHRRDLLTGQWDILHVHWPDLAHRTDSARHGAIDRSAFLAMVSLARARGTRVIWTAHNVQPHDATVLGHRSNFMRFFVRQVDHLIALSEASVDELRHHYPALRNTPVSVIPHGHYRTAYPRHGLSKGDGRSRLGISGAGRVLLHLGQIRPYKNVVQLIERFRRVAGADDRLLVAGRPLDEALQAEILLHTHEDPRVVLHLRHVPDEDIETYLAAADVVVLPYTTVLNSGAAILALSFDRPVVVPAAGSLVEAARSVGLEWVHPYEGTFDDEVVARALRLPLPTGQAPLDHLSWEALGNRTTEVYQETATAPRATRTRRRSR